MRYAPEENHLDQKLLEPTLAHLLGTDHLGRDILARLAFGARFSLLIGFAAVGVGLIIGVPLGAVSGFYGGWLDLVVGDTRLRVERKQGRHVRGEVNVYAGDAKSDETALDRLLGGTGEGPHPERALSDIETHLLGALLDSTMVELGAAFAPLLKLEPIVVRQESRAQLVRGAAPGSTMIAVCFEVMVGEHGESSTATLCLPLATLGPALESFSGTG